jgi:hypothetical protein
LTFLIDFLESEYAATLQKVDELLPDETITFSLLWAIFVPGEVIFCPCETTRAPRAFRLLEIRELSNWNWIGSRSWTLSCEYVEAADNPSSTGQQLGHATKQINIENFDGVKRIRELVAFPLKYHSQAMALKEKLTVRGREWVKLYGMHHKEYRGLAYMANIPVWVDGRIMIDRRECRG